MNSLLTATRRSLSLVSSKSSSIKSFSSFIILNQTRSKSGSTNTGDNNWRKRRPQIGLNLESRSYSDEEWLTEINAFRLRTGISEFSSPELYHAALTHRSFYMDSNNIQEQEVYDRLEYIGDRVLGLVAAEHMAELAPDAHSGLLSSACHRLCSNVNLAALCRSLGLRENVRHCLHPVSLSAGAVDKILADVTESLVGSIYMDQGIEAARSFLHTHLLQYANPPSENILKFADPKATLRDMAQQNNLPKVSYRMISESGRFTHNPIFQVGAYSDSNQLGEGSGRTIRSAEEAAAINALQSHFNIEPPSSLTQLPGSQ